MVWQALKDLGVFAVGAVVIGWVARYAIKQYFDKELNRYQTELEKEKVMFSELHNERAEITAELYERFVEFEEDMRALTDRAVQPSDSSKEEQLQDASESGNQFMNFYMKNKIYFPPDICETVESLHDEMNSVFHEFQIYQPYSKFGGSAPDAERWQKNWETVTKEEVPELKEELEGHFRELLGVDETN